MTEISFNIGCLGVKIKPEEILCCLCDIWNLLRPRGKIEILEEEMKILKELRGKVECAIERGVHNELAVKQDVTEWMNGIQVLDEEVSEVVRSYPANALVRFYHHLFSNNDFEIQSKIDCAKLLIEQQHKRDSIFTVPSIVGMDKEISQVLKFLNNDPGVVIGIHGMGGVGKTTLAKQLINILQSSSSSPSTSAAARGQESVKFDVIILAVVSRNLDIGKLQEDIAVKLNLHENSGFQDKKKLSNRAHFISSYLSKIRFLLVLDDVWKKLDLISIGIPKLPDCCFGSKIVLTTREAKVCAKMGARVENIVKVGCLGPEDSWVLFEKTIGWEVGRFKAIGVSEIARDIASKCGGLPLVIVTIARAMATKDDKELWECVKDELQVSPNEIGDMEYVYKLLQVSYNHLEKEENKSCLLYSALFREDEEIPIKIMVDYWIGGGSVPIASGSSSSNSISRNISQLRRKGRIIISELIDACLLERGEDEQHVRVHDAIRDMILNRIGRQNSGSRIVSYAGKELTGNLVVKVEELRDASMLSFSYNYLKKLVIVREEDHFQANNLQVLLLNGSGLIEASDWTGRRYVEILQVECLFSPTLRVLDLSLTDIEEIPLSLCSLKLLQYLNLSETVIKALRKEMGKLENLLQLDLGRTHKLKEIPNGLFSSLSKLQSLHLSACAFFGSDGIQSLPVLKEIGNLHLLQDVSLDLDDVDALKFILVESDSLSNSITELHLGEMDIFRDDLFKRMRSRLKKLRWLRIEGGDCEEDLVIDDGHFPELKDLWIENVGSFGQIILNGQALKDLTCLEIAFCDALRTLACLWKLRNLKNLSIFGCQRIVELMDPSQSEGDEISDDQAFLPKLESLALTRCPNLLRLSSSPVQLHSLKSLYFSRLTCLKDISTINSPHEVEIRCAKKWWEDLQWEGLKPSNFKPIFCV